MKKKSFPIGKVILRIFAVIFILAVLFIGFFGIKGYNMYKKATEKRTIEEIVESIRSQDNFILYEELPEIYIDAVIS
ncbi:MAG: glycosyl transferase, partial [Ruminococcus flavefaciens]|nr:glycosyl transferase [Ruminococcus flavefaciens]